jgi:hypothetical protein
MSSTFEDGPPQRGVGLALLGGVLLVVMGLYGGWLVFGGAAPAVRADLLGAASSTRTGTGSEVLQVPVLTTSGSAVQGNGVGGAPPSKAITVSAVLTGQLGPGSPAALLVTITNPNSQSVEVTSVSGAVTSVATGSLPGRATCSASWYHVAAFTGSRTVARNSSTTVPLAVTFDDVPTTNQDNCKGALFSYSFTAQARQA